MGQKRVGTDFVVKYGGKPNEIDAKVLLRSLGNITTIIEEVNNEIGEGRRLDIRIKAPERGSFLLHVGLIPSQMVDLIQQLDLDTVYKVVGTLLGLFLLRKHLKGERPEKVEKHGDDVTITTKSGNKITVDKRTYNFHNGNVVINEALSDNFEVLQSDSSIESFEIIDTEGREVFQAPRDEFEFMSLKSVVDLPEENKRITEELAKLHILKLVFAKGRKWEFLLRGQKISAFITDEAFMQRVMAGERKFASGDCLEVDLQITQVFDEQANAFRNDSYTVTRVRNHIPRPNQGDLNIIDKV